MASDEGKTIKVKVSFTDDRDNSETLTSEALEPVTGYVNTPATGTTTITGTAQVGVELTATTSSIIDADGTTHAKNGDTGYQYTYQWILDDGATCQRRSKFGPWRRSKKGPLVDAGYGVAGCPGSPLEGPALLRVAL